MPPMSPLPQKHMGGNAVIQPLSTSVVHEHAHVLLNQKINVKSKTTTTKHVRTMWVAKQKLAKKLMATNKLMQLPYFIN